MLKINPFVEDFVKQGVLKTPAIIDAFKKIDRKDFLPRSDAKHLLQGVPNNLEEMAYVNEPLTIGRGQTISQPYTVAFMIELLKPKAGDKIFEIGFGSGWQTALLAEIIGKRGKIYTMERIPELYRFGRKNVAKYNFIKNGTVKMIGGDATLGLKRHAPFDKIIAAASAEELPEEWLKELKIGGRLVAPIKESIWLYVKESDKEFKNKEYPGFSFVPLVANHES